MTDIALLKKKALTFLDESNFLSLATVSNAEPWVVTLTYAFDTKCNLFFYSDPETKHCQDLTKNPSVAVAIYSSNLKPRQILGIQLIGLASIGSVEDFEVFKKRNPWADDYPGYKLCKVEPSKLYYLDSEFFGHKNKVEIPL